ncbi:MAG TPA: MFS transporter [Phycisphaerae bacterium]|nr:MFS transporter [Phycisphaerae bacterium]
MADVSGASLGGGGSRRGLKFLFRALASRNYRLFVTGQLISLVGTWLTITATGWLVFRLTGREDMLGIVTAAGQVPAFALSLFAGVIVDRLHRLPLLKWAHALAMLESFGLAVVAFWASSYGQHVPPQVARAAIWGLCGLVAFQGLLNAFEVPARQSLVVHMVDRREDLGNAIALNSTMFNLARAIGPLIAGSLIYVLNEGWCFTIDGFSYGGVLIALWMMRVNEPPPPPKSERRHVLVELKEGVKYVGSFHALRGILTLLGMVSFSSASANLFVPVYAKEILHGNSLTQAVLMAAGAVGALGGAIRLAAKKTVLGLGREMVLAAIGLAVGMSVYGLGHWLWVCMAGLCVVGFCTMTLMASGNTLLQTLVEDRMRGRVMSLFVMAFMGMMPLGSLVAGFVAQTSIGPQWTVVMGGGLCLVSAAIFALRLPAIRAEVRPIYVKKGIMKEAAAGLQVTETAMDEARE